MSLLDKASLIVTPNAYKASKLYSVIPSDGSGDMTVVRATTASRVNELGLIENVGLNVPRIDYTNGGCPSILVEPQRTNLVYPSAIATTQIRTVTAVAHTLSFYGTGSVALSGAYVGSLVGTGVDNKVTLTFTPTAGSLILTVTGSVTDWQLEVGSNATSYIPTVASAVTRNADVISKTGIADLIGQTEGTLFVELNYKSLSSTARFITISNGTNNNVVQFYFPSNSLALRAYISINGTTVYDGNIKVFTNLNNFFKVAISYKSGDTKIYVDGNLLITRNIIFSTGLFDRLSFANQVNLSFFEGEVNSVQLYKTALTDTECIALTTL